MDANSFDYIFMLGVSSYLRKEDLEQFMPLFGKWLNDEGRIIISFTHRRSLEHLIRTCIKPLLRLLPFKKRGVIQQDFNLTAFSLSEFSKLLPATLFLKQAKWHNQTFSPFNQLLPQLSIQLAYYLKKHLPGYLLPFFSADFLVHLHKVR
ncbi:MAG: hypothetical protein IPN76_10225 [Saprospiraceae bacterium]|nr:hypothetical protein [Saprospiraceae bacterium]